MNKRPSGLIKKLRINFREWLLYWNFTRKIFREFTNYLVVSNKLSRKCPKFPKIAKVLSKKNNEKINTQ